MYNTILVPLDGSKRAEAILPHVRKMARHYNAKLILTEIIVAEPVTDMDYRVETDEKTIERSPATPLEIAETYLANIQKDFESENIETEAHIGEGPIAETIIEIAKHANADLIAMASHGRTGLGHVFYGSVAAGVLHRADRPLLMIRSV
jgi:nucleotide-binding universal stress UspA family protein